MGNAWTCRYRSISSDFQRPRSLILSVSTAAHSRAIAPEERKDRIEMSLGVMPQVAPMAATAVRRCWVRMVVVMDCQRPLEQ
jgi:hypothetical protein